MKTLNEFIFEGRQFLHKSEFGSEFENILDSETGQYVQLIYRKDVWIVNVFDLGVLPGL